MGLIGLDWAWGLGLGAWGLGLGAWGLGLGAWGLGLGAWGLGLGVWGLGERGLYPSTLNPKTFGSNDLVGLKPVQPANAPQELVHGFGEGSS